MPNQKNAAMKGLMSAAPMSPDSLIKEREMVNAMLNGKPAAEPLPPAPDRPGLQGPQRTGDIGLSSQWSMDELMRRSKALTGQ